MWPTRLLYSQTHVHQLSEKINDAFFAKDGKASRSSAEEEFFANGKPKEKEALPEAKTSEQKAVDAAVLAGVKKTAHLEKYLKASWGLSKGQFPHQVRTWDVVGALVSSSSLVAGLLGERVTSARPRVMTCCCMLPRIYALPSLQFALRVLYNANVRLRV